MTRSASEGEIWENMISRNPPDDEFEVLGPARDYCESASHAAAHAAEWDKGGVLVSEALARDTYPLPVTSDREGYYGPHHFRYWASGLREMHSLLEYATHYGLKVKTYLDIGCASGRVLRHFAMNSDLDRVMGCDINRRHIEWILTYLPGHIEVFQNTSVPGLQIEDSSIDLISAFSVFTHIENFDMTWIMEIRRVLRPGGIAWITFLSEKYWLEIKESSALYDNWRTHPEFSARRGNLRAPFRRMVFRRRSDRSYTSLVFYHTDFLRHRWGRVLTVLDIRRRGAPFQDAIILQKSL